MSNISNEINNEIIISKINSLTNTVTSLQNKLNIITPIYNSINSKLNNRSYNYLTKWDLCFGASAILANNILNQSMISNSFNPNRFL